MKKILLSLIIVISSMVSHAQTIKANQIVKDTTLTGTTALRVTIPIPGLGGSSGKFLYSTGLVPSWRLADSLTITGFHTENYYKTKYVPQTSANGDNRISVTNSSITIASDIDEFYILGSTSATPGYVLMDEDGSGRAVWSEPPMFGSTTGQIVAVTTNSDANPGHVGEYIGTSLAVGSAVTCTTATSRNVLQFAINAGDWDIDAIASFDEGSATVTERIAGISTTTATLPSDGTEGYCGAVTTALSEKNSITLTTKRLSLSGTTTVYLVVKATFSAGTVRAFGTIRGRRVR